MVTGRTYDADLALHAMMQVRGSCFERRTVQYDVTVVFWSSSCRYSQRRFDWMDPGATKGGIYF